MHHVLRKYMEQGEVRLLIKTEKTLTAMRKRKKSASGTAGRVCLAAGLWCLTAFLVTGMEYLREERQYDSIAEAYTAEADSEAGDDRTPDDAGLKTDAGKESVSDYSCTEVTAENPAYLNDPALSDSLVVDFDRLEQLNPDYTGWIHLPTGAGYPVVRGRSTGTYLHTDFYGKPSFAGTIFMHPDCSRDFSDRHTILYGHNMRDGTMSGRNDLYADPAYTLQHPYFWIHVKGGYYTFRVFRMLKVPDGSETYETGFITDSEMNRWIESQEEYALYTLEDAVPEQHIHVITLSTCASAGGKLQRQPLQACAVCFTGYSGKRRGVYE